MNRRTVPVSALKASLSRYLRQVQSGEEVIVTELEREGRIRPGTARLPDDFWRLPRPKDTKGLLRRALRKERERSYLAR